MNYFMFIVLSSFGLLFNNQVTAENCTYGSIRLFTNTTAPVEYGAVQLCDSSRVWSDVCGYNWHCSLSIIACKQLGYQYTSASRIKYKLQFGPTTRFSFSPYRSCSISYSTLFACGTYSSSYKTNPQYCNLNTDTVGLNCTAVYSSCTSGSVRLVNNQTSNRREGRIEYCHEGKWSPFCTQYSLTTATAYQLCFELGYRRNSFASVFSDGRFGSGSSPNWFNYLQCSSQEQPLSQCYRSVSSGACPASECNNKHYGIRCYEPVTCNEGVIRSVNGTLLNEGRIEVCTNGVWGSICGSNFDPIDAVVACRELGYTSGGYVTRNSAFGIGDGPIVYTDVTCAGHEANLFECSKTIYFGNTCLRERTAGITCWDGCTHGDVRLTGGSSPTEGTVEICYDHIWGLVSQVGWNDEDSEVVCDQLGHDSENIQTVYNSTFGKPNRAIYLSNVNCDGMEDKLEDCRHSSKYTLERGRLLLPYVQVVGVRCQGNETAYRTLEYQPITSISAHLNTTGSVTVMTTPLTEPGLGARERAILGVGGTMIIVATAAIVIVIIVIGCFIWRQRHVNMSVDLQPITHHSHQHDEHQNPHPQQAYDRKTPRLKNKPLPKPPPIDDGLYELS